MSLYDSPSVFLLRKLELIKMLDLLLSYAAIMDIITPLFTVVLQDFLDMKQVANLDNLFVTLRAYEQRHAPRQQINSASAPRFSSPPQSQQNRSFTQQNSFQRRRDQFTPPQRNRQHASARPGAAQSFSVGNNNRRSLRSNLNLLGDCHKNVPSLLWILQSPPVS